MELVPSLTASDLVLFLTVDGDAFPDLPAVGAAVTASPAKVAHLSVGLEGSDTTTRPSVDGCVAQASECLSRCHCSLSLRTLLPLLS